MNLYDRILGIPWVYDRVRPFVVGGLDFSPIYSYLEGHDNDVIVDVGCGTGDVFNYIVSFKEYHGFDIDPRALIRFRQKAPNCHVFAYNRRLTQEDIQRIMPNKVVLNSLMHHMDDSSVFSLLKTLAIGRFVERVVTLDTVYIKGKFLNNFYAFLDRGRYVRTENGYENLIAQSPFFIYRKCHTYSKRGRTSYYTADLRLV